MAPLWDSGSRGSHASRALAEVASALGLKRETLLTYCTEEVFGPWLRQTNLDDALPGWRQMRREALEALIARHGPAMPVAHRLVLRETFASPHPLTPALLAQLLGLPEAEVTAVVAQGLRYAPPAAAAADTTTRLAA